jgi:two-component system chemotaxis response regulator CheY
MSSGDAGKPLELASLHLLLAEDEAFSRKLTLATLQRIGIRSVVAVENGAEALNAIAAARAPFHIIVSDWNMPGINGLELLRLVREYHPHMPFLMLTGHADQDLVMAARAARVNGYVVKPFSADQLKSKIAVALGIKT